MCHEFFKTLKSSELRPCIIIIVTAILCGVIIYINTNYLNLDNITISSVVGILGSWGVGIALAIATVNYLNNRNFQLRKEKYHKKVTKEIQYNKNKLNVFRSHLAIVEQKWLDIANWDQVLFPKCTSIRPYSQYLNQYLPANAYHYFITIEDFDLESGRLARMNNFYVYCINFSLEIQIAENEIHEFRLVRKNYSPEDYESFIRTKCGYLRQQFDYYKIKIDNEYSNLSYEDIVVFDDQQLINCP